MRTQQSQGARQPTAHEDALDYRQVEFGLQQSDEPDEHEDYDDDELDDREEDDYYESNQPQMMPVAKYNRNDPPVRNLQVSTPDRNLYKPRSTDDLTDQFHPINQKRRGNDPTNLSRSKSDTEDVEPSDIKKKKSEQQ